MANKRLGGVQALGGKNEDAIAGEGDEFEQRQVKLRCHGRQEVGTWDRFRGWQGMDALAASCLEMGI